jgi:hypothetical protein
MFVLLSDSIACELGLLNSSRGIFREFVYDDQENPAVFKVKSEVFLSNTIYMCIPLYVFVETNISQKETSLSGLRPKLMPVPFIIKKYTIFIK